MRYFNNIKLNNMEDRIIIRKVVTECKTTNSRIAELKSKGYDVKRCYVPTYNKLLGETIMKRKKVIRIIIGRPRNHWSREVYAVDLPL